ncbi:uncharacterized protein LOC133844840 [Drosophila sulfurigaster albostrigata]|uniref:uncharacterized protein LOC133844840 n=1 Tax=Drosophila sulfurigaster albostrigata TaxID=89887 RepID=UPI002D21BE94|nr:uncharacterized protein LOC133844840 [Drosophila sulfurigaster albostrigata]
MQNCTCGAASGIFEMDSNYNVILLPIITAVMLSYNRPVSLDEIADGVMALLSSQREKISPMTSNSVESASDASYAKISPAHRKRK